MVSVPTKDSVTDAGSSGIAGIAPGLGAAFGRGFLGPGLGTAIGGIAGASALDGASRDRMAELVVYDSINELLTGGASGASASSTEEVV